MRASAWILFAVFTGLATTGCEGDDEAPDTAAPEPSPDAAQLSDPCPDWAQDLIYGPKDGLIAWDESGEIGARVVWAAPVPAFNGENTWKIQLENAAGEPVSDPIVRWVCAFSPDHVHGTAPELDAGLTPDDLTINDLHLWRAGGWEVRLWIDAVDSRKDTFEPTSPCAPTDEPTRPHDITLGVCVPEGE